MSAPPKRFTQFMETDPEISSAYQALGEAVADAGPLDAKTRALVKLGITVGARMEGATHSQCRKCLDAGATPEEIKHAVLQATTTIGFPNMMAGMAWVEDVLEAGA